MEFCVCRQTEVSLLICVICSAGLRVTTQIYDGNEAWEALFRSTDFFTKYKCVMLLLSCLDLKWIWKHNIRCWYNEGKSSRSAEPFINLLLLILLLIIMIIVKSYKAHASIGSSKIDTKQEIYMLDVPVVPPTWVTAASWNASLNVGDIQL